MMYYLLRYEGIFVGPSAALNVAGAVRVARTLPVGSTVVTILCDHGDRYWSKAYSEDWLRLKKLEPADDLSSLDFLASGV
jgi:cysteine synthase A